MQCAKNEGPKYMEYPAAWYMERELKKEVSTRKVNLRVILFG